MRATSGTACTLSCCSWGRTWQNQPTAPDVARITPSVLTAALVSSPAKIRAMPKARMKGHAVGAGIWTVTGVTSRAAAVPEVCGGLMAGWELDSYLSLGCGVDIANHLPTM